MKTLFLVRHARAARLAIGTADFERSLTKKGRKEVVNLGQLLKNRNETPDLIISSPAFRAADTAHILANMVHYKEDAILFEDFLYDAAVPALVAYLRKLDDAWQRVMIIGHNPVIEGLSHYLLQHFEERIPQAGAVLIELPDEKWKELRRGEGTLKSFDFPQMMIKRPRLIKIIKQYLRSELTGAVEEVFSAIDAGTYLSRQKLFEKMIHRLVRIYIKELNIHNQDKYIALIHKLSQYQVEQNHRNQIQE